MLQAANSSTEIQLLEYAEQLFAPLVREGVFDSFEQALRTLLLDYVERKIGTYKQKVTEFESRYQQTFGSYSVSLQNRATPDDEETWMDWETALTFLNKWQRVRAQVVKVKKGGVF